MKKWTLELVLEVSDNWIEDGFNLANRLEEIEEKIGELLPWAYSSEFKVKARLLKGEK